MNLIKRVNEQANKILEDAAGGAVSAGSGAIAGFAMPLFSTLVNRSSPPITVIKWNKKKKVGKKKGLGLGEAYHTLAEDFQDDTGVSTNTSASATKFDTSEVMAKLKGLENKDKQDHRDTVTFGLEDSNGDLVRVVIKQEQAEDFERSLQALLAEKNNDGELPEIAELLFKLKDQFDIVDVEWPEVSEDEEQEVGLEPNAQGGQQQSTGGAPGQQGAGEMPGEVPPGDEAPGEDLSLGGENEDTGKVQDLLTQVIDMMKSDAEARKAEARAREAEAKTREADSLVHHATSKVKQEEQFLDMDTYNKAKKDEEKEAKRLAQLAKWKHEMKEKEGVMDETPEEDLSDVTSKTTQHEMPEEEEYAQRYPKPNTARPQRSNKGSTVKGRVSPYDIASFILNRVK